MKILRNWKKWILVFGGILVLALLINLASTDFQVTMLGSIILVGVVVWYLVNKENPEAKQQQDQSNLYFALLNALLPVMIKQAEIDILPCQIPVTVDDLRPFINHWLWKMSERGNFRFFIRLANSPNSVMSASLLTERKAQLQNLLRSLAYPVYKKELNVISIKAHPSTQETYIECELSMRGVNAFLSSGEPLISEEKLYAMSQRAFRSQYYVHL